MNPSKVDIATEADWSFYENRAVRRAAGSAARTVADKFPDTADVSDLEQDALLFLAVRPEMVATYVGNGRPGMKALWRRIYRYLYERAEREAVRSNRTVSSELLPVVDCWADAGGGALH
jgi:hypothetical protein